MGLTRPVTVVGSGLPVTVVAHGLGASVAETRPLAGGVPGTRVLYAARGHGPAYDGEPRPLPPDDEVPDPRPGDGEPPPRRPGDQAPAARPPDAAAPVGGPTAEDLGRDLEQVADAHGATQVLGVSMGAGAALSLLARRPDRFERAVLFLPAALDRPRTDEAAGRLALLAAALRSGDREATARLVTDESPGDVAAHAGFASYVRERTDFLLASPGLPDLLAALPLAVPVADRTQLAAVTADVLVLAQEGDALHPAQVARELVAVLPRARLVVFDRPGVVWRERARLRSLIVTHLTLPDSPQ